MKLYLDSIKSTIPSFTEELLDISFRDAGIDSIDLVTIRVNFERISNSRIADRDWLNFENVKEVIDHCLAFTERSLTNNEATEKESSKQSIIINMPQMAVAALSENWLFKEIGGIHWNKICEGLSETSFNLKDELGNRLYATFVRIRINCKENLSAFKESEVLDIAGKINRFGDSIYLSNIRLLSNEQFISAELMTTFSIRNESDNTNLAKSQPAVIKNSVKEVIDIPDFVNDYRLLKKGVLNTIEFQNYKFTIKEEVLFETEYVLNPYYDLNGVNLLYFAAYPIINDTCEARYFNQNSTHRWEQTYYTSYKDIFYFSNCNINEILIYQLVDKIELDDGSFQLQSVLKRKSDFAIMARIFSVKSKSLHTS